MYVHPFAEEMNKARRMAALQSRRLAAAGWGVLQIDLLGCGDSSGEFADARWAAWKRDVPRRRGLAAGARRRSGRACGACGSGRRSRRTARAGRTWTIDSLVLWQPVGSGEQFLTQFLRLQLAAEMLTGGAAQTGVRELRETLARGTVLEIGGYELHPELAAAIDGLKLAELVPAVKRVHLARGDRPARAADYACVAARRSTPGAQRGLDVRAAAVTGEPFWSTLEIAECAALLDATDEAMRAAMSCRSTRTSTDKVRTRIRKRTEPPMNADGRRYIWTQSNTQFESDMAKNEQALTFECEGETLVGVLHGAARRPRRGVLIVVGGPQYRVGSHRQFVLLARHLAAHGVPVLRFDYRGMGDSAGDRRTFERVDADLRCALDAVLRGAFPACRRSSSGACATRRRRRCSTRRRTPACAGIVLLNPWVHDEQGSARVLPAPLLRKRLFQPSFWKKIGSGEFSVRRAAGGFWNRLAAAPSAASRARGAGTPARRRARRGADAPLHGAHGGGAARISRPRAARIERQRFHRAGVQGPGRRRPGAGSDCSRTAASARCDLAAANHTFSRRDWRDQVARWTEEWIRSW